MAALTTSVLATLKRKLRAIDVTRKLVPWLESLENGTGLLAGFLTADAAGRAKMAAGYFGLVPASLAHFADDFWAASVAARAKFADGLWDTTTLAKFVDGFLTAAKLAFEPVHDAGALPVTGLRLTADLNAGDFITITDGVTPEAFYARAAPAVAYEFLMAAARRPPWPISSTRSTTAPPAGPRRPWPSPATSRATARRCAGSRWPPSRP